MHDAPQGSDKDFALASMVRALRHGEVDVFAGSVAAALDAGATPAEVDAALAGAYAQASDYPSARPRFDPNELSEVFGRVPAAP